MNLKKLLVSCEVSRKDETLSMFGARTIGVGQSNRCGAFSIPYIWSWTERFHLLLAPLTLNPLFGQNLRQYQVYGNIPRTLSLYINTTRSDGV